MSERSERPGGHGEAMPSQHQGAGAPTAAELANGRHEKRAGDPERTSLFTPDGGLVDQPTERPGGHGDQPGAGPVPPWQRITAQSGGDPAQTEVRRPVGAATAVDQQTGPSRTEQGHAMGSPGKTPAAQPGSPGPQNPQGGQNQQGAPPANGQLANPFGGSGPDAAGPTVHLDQPTVHQPVGDLGSFGQPQRPPNRPTARPNTPPRVRTARAPRKASLQIRRFDPWSVLKLSLVLSVAMFLMWLVAVGVLYGVLSGMGVWDKVNGAWNDLASVNESGGGGGEELISAGRVFGVSAVIGAVNIVLFTAFATVTAFVYNVSADLAGGVEVTLSERD